MTFQLGSTETSKVYRSETRCRAGRISTLWGNGTLRAISHASPAYTVLSRALNREGSRHETIDAGCSQPLDGIGALASLSCLGHR